MMKKVKNLGLAISGGVFGLRWARVGENFCLKRCFIRLRVSAKGMRTIDKHGLEKVLSDIKAREK